MGLFKFLFGDAKTTKTELVVSALPPKQALMQPPIMPEEYRQLLSFRASNHKESDWAYSKYLKMIAEISPYEKCSPPTPPTAITTSEVAFLKYMDGLPAKNPFIAQHWFYEQGFYYPHKIRLFLSQGYLTVSSLPNINKVTVAQLKEALKGEGIDAKGKKADLIATIVRYFDAADYLKYFPNCLEHYELTPTGKRLVDALPRSATYDLELEDRCVELISAGSFEAAAQEISIHDEKTGRIRGIGTSGSAPIQSKKWYKKYLESAALSQKTYHACFIFCDMIGVPHKQHLLAKRQMLDAFSDEALMQAQNAYHSHSDAAYGRKMRKLAKELGRSASPQDIHLTPPRQKLEPSAKDHTDFDRLCKINKTQTGIPMPLSDEEKAFILEVVVLFNYHQLDAAKIKLQRLSNGVFNVNYPGCYAGKFQIKNNKGFVQYSKGMYTTNSIDGSFDTLVGLILKWISYIKWCNSNK